MAQTQLKLFLSYAAEDERAVEELYDRLRADNLLPWMAKRNIHAGENWERAIWRAVREADYVLVCLSKTATGKRGFLQKEIKQALEIWKEKLEDDIYLIPIKLEECTVPRPLSDFHWLTLFEPDGYTRLLKSIRIGMERRGAELSQAALAQQLTIIPASIVEREERQCDLNIEYPTLQPNISDAANQANDRLFCFAQESAQRFRTEWVRWGFNPNETSLWPILEIKYSVGLITPSFVSFRFTIWSFHPSAAHPNSESQTYNFSLSPFAEFRFADIFKKDAGYLNVISEYCIRDLHQQQATDRPDNASAQFTDESIKGGAGPKHDNFSKFLLMPQGLQIIFDAYQVGSYADGRREVFIPVAVLADLVKPDLLSVLIQPA